jgi:hypothetical protein
MPSDANSNPPAPRTVRRRLARWLDVLSRGASPPGLIDIVHTRHAHLHRRFTMIASYRPRPGRWSATGLAISLLVAGVALTGAVKGQDAAAPTQSPAPVAAGAPAPAPAPVQTTDRAGPAAAREVRAAPAAYSPGSATPAAAAPGDGGAKDEDVDQALLAQLDRKVPEVNFNGVGFTDVVDFLRDVSGANLVVEWKALEAAGIDRNSPVSLRTRNVKFGRVLDLILSGVSGGTVPIGYSVDDNIIRVSTLEDLDKITDVRAYDVRDIVPAELPMDDLVKMITETVASDSWRESGGTTGAVHVSKHKLIVTQTPMNHRQIRSVLQMLREQPPAGGATGRDAAPAADATSPAIGGRQ